ncbi:hypothetical protein [Methylopila sp. M107]|uniref:hypothetical protein n=1 Tax=Methylopila sp. M107 TaxID=1101190 RepID=UPI0003823DE7|nr:hypothetical protein [Methylopila sp. M107]
MKREKIYEFKIDKALNAARRKALEDNIEKRAELSPKPFEYGWEEDADVLHILLDPVDIEVEFQPEKVELFATAPLWAKVGFTEKKKAELRGLVETVLQDSKFITAK